MINIKALLPPPPPLGHGTTCTACWSRVCSQSIRTPRVTATAWCIRSRCLSVTPAGRSSRPTRRRSTSANYGENLFTVQLFGGTISISFFILCKKGAVLIKFLNTGWVQWLPLVFLLSCLTSPFFPSHSLGDGNEYLFQCKDDVSFDQLRYRLNNFSSFSWITRDKMFWLVCFMTFDLMLRSGRRVWCCITVDTCFVLKFPSHV